MEDPSQKRVFVTGAGGFIGRHTLAPLHARGYRIHGVLAPEEPAPDADFVDWQRADLLNTAEARSLVLDLRPTHLLNLAWYVAPGNLYGALQNFRWLQTGIELVLSFVESGGQRIVTVGSCAEYDWSHGILSENTTPLHPDSHYGLAKKALSEVQASILETTDLSGAWARPFLIYGPHENPKRFVSAVITSLLQDEPSKCTDGLHRRDFLHVQDVADALVAILDSGLTGPVNVASGEAHRLCDIATRIADLIGKPELLRLGALPHARPEAPLVQGDTARIRNALGWTPRFDLESGLRDTIAWWKSHLEPETRKT